MRSPDFPARAESPCRMRAALYAGILCLAILSGCGMRGALYLPPPDTSPQTQDPEKK